MDFDDVFFLRRDVIGDDALDKARLVLVFQQDCRRAGSGQTAAGAEHVLRAAETVFHIDNQREGAGFGDAADDPFRFRQVEDAQIGQTVYRQGKLGAAQADGLKTGKFGDVRGGRVEYAGSEHALFLSEQVGEGFSSFENRRHGESSFLCSDRCSAIFLLII